MSDNVGLSTPRGSGTSGYVQRNLAQMRPRDMASPYARDKDFESMRHTQRKPDQGLLEHDRKREVEVKVFELRDKLEEEGVDEEEIDTQCDELRKKLLEEMERKFKGGPGPLRKNLKSYQVHELADAKIKESEKLRQAFRISKDYEEGSHWRKQEERLKKTLERETMPEEVKEADVKTERNVDRRARARDWDRDKEADTKMESDEDDRDGRRRRDDRDDRRRDDRDDRRRDDRDRR